MLLKDYFEVTSLASEALMNIGIFTKTQLRLEFDNYDNDYNFYVFGSFFDSILNNIRETSKLPELGEAFINLLEKTDFDIYYNPTTQPVWGYSVLKTSVSLPLGENLPVLTGTLEIQFKIA